MSTAKLLLYESLLFILLFSIPAVSYAGTSTILGSTHGQCESEINSARNLANFIGNWSLDCGYITLNWNGPLTTVENIYQATYGDGDPYAISYYSGHGRVRPVWIIWPIFAENHWDIFADDGTYVADDHVYPYTICRNNRFVFLWACNQGDVIGGTHFWTGPYGMPHCWLHTTDLSTDGYANPDGKGYTFIGFYGVGPGFTQEVAGEANAGFLFVQWFYYCVLMNNASINEALDEAARNVWFDGDPNKYFSDCPFYNGFTIGNDYGRMVVYGDGNIKICDPPPKPPPPPAPCPFAYTWNGQSYVMDNNILPTSERSNGTDVQDFYKLEQTLVPIYQGLFFSLHSLQIREFEQEHDYIDYVELLAVDHAPDVKIAVSPNGEILTYRNPDPPYSCVDNHGNNRLNEILLMDGNVSEPSTYFYGERDDFLILNFGEVNSVNAKLILRSDMKCRDQDAGCCIEVQVLNNSQWQTVTVVAPREYWATEGVNLSPYIIAGQELAVRLYWTLPHRLDYVGLDTTAQENYTIKQSILISAIHSTEGNVLQKLMANDNSYAELVPIQQIQLTFLLLNNLSTQQRTFIFYTEGHYYTITQENP